MLNITADAQLRPLNTMQIEGTSAWLVEWRDVADLEQLFMLEAYREVVADEWKAVGQGSNLLFTTGRYDGALLKCTNSEIVTLDETATAVKLKVGSGCELDALVEAVCKRELWGIENLSLIPGTVGGAAVQNVGAYGVEFGDVVDLVHCFDTVEKMPVTLPVETMNYGYRNSALKHEPLRGRYIVTSVIITLSKFAEPRLAYGNLKELRERHGDELTAADVRREIVSIRNGKLPVVGQTGSAGSFFKNPIVEPDAYEQVKAEAAARGVDTTKMPAHRVVTASGEVAIKLSAAWLIDHSGWKGIRRGNAGTWPQQPLVLINATGRADGAEIVALAHEIVADVASKWGITLEPEVEFI